MIQKFSVFWWLKRFQMTEKGFKKVSKGTILQREGDKSSAAYHVLKGCLKSYVIDASGKEHIIQFAPEDWFITDMDSFTNGTPSLLFIEAIEDSEIHMEYDPAAFNFELFERNELVNIATKLRNSIIAANKRLINLLSASAETRYHDFVKTYPTLVQRLPLKLIASYIGITPEYLSEIRRKIARKG
ncbi:Crp/Fnr family transcriptional regulator [Jiulongibacter sp. NS-SX5]|uniref:Crp/Fnr family transcriptional regulator n=1 Tax=Jiulongibacter sp. NS-SX5 TaxID=3463854 RepID=UPI00405A44E5